MSADIKTLMQQVHDYFLNLFQQLSSSTLGSTFLLFEPIGIPLTSSMFKLNTTDAAYSLPLAVEEFSSLVNTIPNVGADTFQRTDKQVDDFYEALLVGSLPVDASNTLFTTLKAEAVKRFEPTLGSLRKALVQFHPSYATPNDWYDPSTDGNWAEYTFSDGQSTTTTIGNVPIVPIPLIHPIGFWTWNLLPEEAEPALTDPRLLRGFVANAGIAVNPNPRTRRFPTPSTHLPEVLAETRMAKPIIAREEASAPFAATSPLIAIEQTSVLDEFHPSILHAVEFTPLIDKYTSSQAVESNTLTITFKYCLVTIDRPWFSQALLSLPNWYVAGYQAGAFSTGTSENNTGLLPVLPVACLVIKNLQITAQWTQSDTIAIQRAATFGPFSLIGRSVDSGQLTLRASGMQVIGWVCQVMPLLPPVVPPT